ncbi:hypothetical protein LOZ53_004044 [Ophidiomyces ophidiicola]|nr:hypothetical protein LOZ55_004604 [Ophidiomyces ophidiicola]KAI1988215.1 hypothetical protein LOZ53_004044 [Ophidiomyces ophidiicola]KAI1988724.1 hypothetical protein LOZ54_003130 [Ophidiomyces ophidiicola]KAI1999123.1 hypothetical protein LOZ51_001609 [Ophidiomyces ophidiicola]
MRYILFTSAFSGLLFCIRASPIATGSIAQATPSEYDPPSKWLPLPPAPVATSAERTLYRVASRNNKDENEAAVPHLPEILSGFARFLNHREENTVKTTGGIQQSTENGVTGHKTCEPLTLIYARGTEEAGNIGTVVGPHLTAALRRLLNNKVTIQGVNYPATARDTSGLGADGGPAMAALVKQALANCPATKIAVAGYSQGAMVLHDAAEILGNGKVAAAVVFGDPLRYLPLDIAMPGNIRKLCARGDPVCGNGEDISLHRSYGEVAEEAAQFIIKATEIR